MNIIGQTKLISHLKEQIENKTLARFIILSGAKGSGRKTIAKFIAESLNAPICMPVEKINVDYVKDVIAESYKQTEPIVYVLPDADFISESAKNALLKVTEEPPNNAYFIMTVGPQITRYVPQALRSRAIVHRLSVYTVEELGELAKLYNVDTKSKIFYLASVPGDIVNISAGTSDKEEMKKFCSEVINDIGLYSGSKAFTIENRISFKDTDEGFNLNSFWITFNETVLAKAKKEDTNKLMYFGFIRVTNKYQTSLMTTGINKKSLFDMWILDIREVYFKYH